MSLQNEIHALGEQALAASRALARLSAEERCAALTAAANNLEARRAEIHQANQRDLLGAREEGLSAALLDRLELNAERVDSMIQGVREIAAVDDLLGEVLEERVLESGLRLQKIRVPLGVVAVIYESRPNVTVDAAALCVKSGNAVILRGGKEAIHTNRVLAEIIQQAAGLPTSSVQLVQTTDRQAVAELVSLEGLVDVAIPRGGEGLIRAVTEVSRVPVIKHYKGVCHVYVDKSADLDKALKIVVNAKCQRPGVCNAMETLLVDEAVAASFLPIACEALKERGVELRADQRACAMIPSLNDASEEDWSAEYLDLVLAIRVLDGVGQAIEHINHFGSHHSDAIVAEDSSALQKFSAEVDSAAVYLNASTRFTDGAVFGLGAEMGISTDKIHARGPMGVEGLTSYKYLLRGDGQTRS